MAIGGGTFTAHDKVLPGAYINVVSVASADSALSDRGIATMPLELDWGIEGEIFTVTNEEFRKDSMKLFGYAYTHEKMKGLRDLFKNIHTLHAYRLNGGGTKASNEYATAKFGGVRGNDLKIVIQKNIDNETFYDVSTVLGTVIVDKQTVSTAAELTPNDYVTFKNSASLAVVAGVSLAGGTNATVDGNAHQTFLDKAESYSFNALGVITAEETVKSLYVENTKRLRDELGIKFQTVIYNKAADFEGVINVKNKTTDTDWSEACLVYWVTGAVAGCAVNKSNLNKVYDGEFAIDTNYTQSQLIKAIKDGEFTLHKVGNTVRVLEDVNSLVTITDDKGEIFKDNQTIRVVDQIANDTAALFNSKYLGEIPNDEAGRESFKADIIKMREELQSLRAIENFDSENVNVVQGNTKKSVVVTEAVQPVNAMAILYMTTTVS